MKEILIAVISFTVSAILISLGMTVVGNFIAPDINLAASYDAASPKIVPENQQVNTEVSVSPEKKDADATDTEKEESSERLIALTDTRSPSPSETNVVEHPLTDSQKIEADSEVVAETITAIEPDKESVVPESNAPKENEQLVVSETIPDKEVSEEIIQPEPSVEIPEEADAQAETSDAEPSDTEESVASSEQAPEKIREELVSNEAPEEMDTSAAEEEILEETVTPEPEIISETPSEEPEKNAVMPVEEPKKEAVPEMMPSEAKPEISPKEESEKAEDVLVSEPDAVQEIVVKEEVKPKTAEEIKELTKSLKNGEKIDLGDGRIAYKVKSGDTFSQICQKVIGTSSTWKDEAKKMNIDYRKIRPGMVLFFESVD